VDRQGAMKPLLEASREDDPLAKLWVAILTYTGSVGLKRDSDGARASAQEVAPKVRKLWERDEPFAGCLLGSAMRMGLIGLDTPTWLP
jgi:hypothetical protein